MNYICAQTLHSLLSASSTVTQTYNTSFKWLFWWLTSGPLFIFNIHLQLKKFGHKSEVSLDVAVGRWFQLQLPFLLFLTCIDVNLIKEDHRSSKKTYTDVNSHTSAIAMLLHVPHAALLVAFMNLIPNHLQLFETPLRQRCSTHLQNRYNNTVREILHPNMHILSSPWFCSKAVWLSFFCGTQKKMFWEMSQGFLGGSNVVWLSFPTFFKTASFRFHGRQKVTQVWDNMRVSQYWYNTTNTIDIPVHTHTTVLIYKPLKQLKCSHGLVAPLIK